MPLRSSALTASFLVNFHCFGVQRSCDFVIRRADFDTRDVDIRGLHFARRGGLGDQFGLLFQIR